MALPYNFSWFIPNRIAASGLPGLNFPLEEHLISLWDAGIRAILTLREQPLESYRIDDERTFSFHHEPIHDHSIPSSVEPVDRAVDFMKQMVEEKKPVLVHCLAGIGRTGMILACYVAVMEKLSAREALRFVEMKRGPVDTFSQEQFTMTYTQIKNDLEE